MREDRDSFVFYPTFYVEADEDIPIESAYRMNNAINRYGVYGERPDMEGWKQWERLHVESAMAQIDAQKERREAGKRGGRPEKEVPPEALAEKYAELGSWKAVAEFFGISERSVYSKKGNARAAENVENVENPSAKTAKSNVEANSKVNSNANADGEGEGARSAPGGKPPSPPHSSKGSAEFPVERARRMPPPTREEVAALCKERGYSFDPATFVSYHAATGWRRNGGAKITDWVAEAERWQALEIKHEAEKARASPASKPYVAPPPPDTTEEERQAIASGLAGIFDKLACKRIAKQAL